MKNLYTILYVLALFLSKSYGQNTVHGSSVKIGYSTLERSSFGVGYNFIRFKDDWSRPAHNYYLEYLPKYKAFGVSANIQYTLIFVKTVMEASFRSKNENNISYFSFYPYLGFDLINGDISFVQKY